MPTRRSTERLPQPLHGEKSALDHYPLANTIAPGHAGAGPPGVALHLPVTSPEPRATPLARLEALRVMASWQLRTSCSQFDRLLDPQNDSVTLDTLQKVAAAVRSASVAQRRSRAVPPGSAPSWSRSVRCGHAVRTSCSLPTGNRPPSAPFQRPHQRLVRARPMRP